MPPRRLMPFSCCFTGSLFSRICLFRDAVAAMRSMRHARRRYFDASAALVLSPPPFFSRPHATDDDITLARCRCLPSDVFLHEAQHAYFCGADRRARRSAMMLTRCLLRLMLLMIMPDADARCQRRQREGCFSFSPASCSRQERLCERLRLPTPPLLLMPRLRLGFAFLRLPPLCSLRARWHDTRCCALRAAAARAAFFARYYAMRRVIFAMSLPYLMLLAPRCRRRYSSISVR